MRVVLLSAKLLALLLAVSAVAAEPENKVDPAVAIPKRLTPEEALAKGRELRQLVDKGDAQAAFDFAVMLSRCGRFGADAHASTVDEWTKLANNRSAFDWVLLAAEAGNQEAIGAVCNMAQDFLAPAHLREKGKQRCEVLRQKYKTGAAPVS